MLVFLEDYFTFAIDMNFHITYQDLRGVCVCVSQNCLAQ